MKPYYIDLYPGMIESEPFANSIRMPAIDMVPNQRQQPFTLSGKKIGRNEQCPECAAIGIPKKYKHCKLHFKG